MKKLKDILIGIKTIELKGNTNTIVDDLIIDSRKATIGKAFIAIVGTQVDGHQFIQSVIEKGCTIVFCEIFPAEINEKITYVLVKNTAEILGDLAANFYDHPSQHLKVVGITGTNGKTTIATLLHRLFTQLGYTCGLISTVENHIGNTVESATHTTPDAISVQNLLARMYEAKCTHVFMEVSSHAVHQSRIAGINFVGAVFSNITHDHLDYHKTFDEYITVKKKFFDDLPKNAFALTNIDDKRGAIMVQNTTALKKSYSLREPASFKGKVIENNLDGLLLSINQQELHCRLVGTFNAYNLLAVYGTAILLGEESMQVLTILSNLYGASGRFETHISTHKKIIGIVDYAHTPDALLNVLSTINQMRNNGQKVYTVIGCGGDRDKAKRPIMAQVACKHSDKTILTADNPRTENVESILDDMEAGMTITQKRKNAQNCRS